MKKNYGAPQMELICVEADIIRTSGPITLFNKNGANGEGAAQDTYGFDIFN